MLSKNEIKDIQSLSHKKHREARDLFVAEGPKIVAELVQIAPQQVQKIYAIDEWLQEHPEMENLAARITQQELERISALQTPNQVLAVLKKFESKPPPRKGFVLYLDAIQDPGNFGTIIRTADWFGVTQIVCGPGCADLYNPKVVQSTMASIARVPVFYDEEGTWLNDLSLPVYAAVLGGSNLHEVQKPKDGVLIIGNESKGVSRELLQRATHRITIPGKGKAESLNAAVATGIILYHLLS